MENKDIISNISYTNRDFQTVYPELLDMTNKLTDKWDPRTSNESDPGVVLLKENAIIADKNSYNIDKNVLETFPLSVTQEKNAMQVFEARGYRPRWYRAATAVINMFWDAEEGEDSAEEASISEYSEKYLSKITIPTFTAFSDSDSSVIYTTTSPVDVYTYVTSAVSTNIASASVIQGTITDYDINGDMVITTDYMDDFNRLYFPYRNVAENGIFITNIYDSTDLSNNSWYGEWKQVENLATQEMANDNKHKFYTFGVDPFTDMPFIEFPENINALIGSGLLIKYIRTDGYGGNVSANTIDRIYSSTTLTVSSRIPSVGWVETEDTVEVSADTLRVYNNSAIGNGTDPESIDSAYRNYTKTVGTFETLVTLRDYENYINSTGFLRGVASNSFVTDRTTDPQYSYKSVVFNKSGESVETRTEVVDSETPAMQAFDIKLYLLNYVPDTSSRSMYEKSFNMYDAVVINNATNETYLSAKVNALLEESKSAQHDFGTIKNADKICFFKNKYTVKCRVFPYSSVTSVQAGQIEQNIQKALYSELGASKIDFGKETAYSTLQNIVLNSDARIQNVVLEFPEYTTYVVYWDSDSNNGKGAYKEVAISDNYLNAYTRTELIDNRGELGVGAPDCDISMESLQYEDSKTPIDPNSFLVGSKILVRGCDFRISENGFLDYGADYYVYRLKRVVGDAFTWEPYSRRFVDVSNFISSDINFFRSDIYARSVLAGNTQLFNQLNEFNIGILDRYICDFENVKSITSETIIPVYFGDGQSVSCESKEKNIPTRIGENESVIFLAPNLIDTDLFSSYIRFVADIRSTNVIPANSDYQLRDDDSIAFFWRDEDNKPFEYRRYGKNTVIHPTFDLSTNVGDLNYNYIRNLTPDTGEIYPELPQFNIEEMTSSQYTLTATKTISIRKTNEIDLSKEGTGEWLAYWVTSKEGTDTNGNDTFILFAAEENPEMLPDGNYVQSYILQDGEFFIYTNLTRTSPIEILGSGTKISRLSSDRTVFLTELSVVKQDYSLIDQYGLSQLSSDTLAKITKKPQILITEMQIVELGNGTDIRLRKDGNFSSSVPMLFSSVDTQVLATQGSTQRTNTVYNYSLQQGRLNSGDSIESMSFSLYNDGNPAAASSVGHGNCDRLYGNQVGIYGCEFDLGHVNLCDGYVSVIVGGSNILAKLCCDNGVAPSIAPYTIYNWETPGLSCDWGSVGEMLSEEDGYSLQLYPYNSRTIRYDADNGIMATIKPSLRRDMESYYTCTPNPEHTPPWDFSGDPVKLVLNFKTLAAGHSIVGYLTNGGSVGDGFTSYYWGASSYYTSVAALASDDPVAYYLARDVIGDEGTVIFANFIPTGVSEDSRKASIHINSKTGEIRIPMQYPEMPIDEYKKYTDTFFKRILVKTTTFPSTGEGEVVYILYVAGNPNFDTSPIIQYNIEYSYSTTFGDSVGLSKNGVTSSYISSTDRNEESLVFTNSGLYNCNTGEKITNLSAYTVEYGDASTESWTKLDKIQIGSTQWETGSRLALNLSTDTPQILRKRQSLSLKYESAESEVTISGCDDKAYCVLSSLPISRMGGENLDVSSLNSSGEKQFPNLFTYIAANASCDCLDEYGCGYTLSTAGYSTKIYLKGWKDGDVLPNSYDSQEPRISQGYGIELPISLKTGEYILPIEIADDPKILDSTEEGTGVWLKYVSNGAYTCDIVPYMNETASYAGTVRRNFFKLRVDETQMADASLLLTLAPGTTYKDGQSYVATVYAPIAYSIYKTDSLSDFEKRFFDRVEKHLYSIDSYYNAFDYSWKVYDEIRIDNPLDSKEFFNSNHVFNRNTISYIERTDKGDDFNEDAIRENVETIIYNKAR